MCKTFPSVASPASSFSIESHNLIALHSRTAVSGFSGCYEKVFGKFCQANVLLAIFPCN